MTAYPEPESRAQRGSIPMPCAVAQTDKQQLDRATHFLWVKALRHLDAALQTIEQVGSDSALVASHIENARVHAKRYLRPARAGGADTPKTTRRRPTPGAEYPTPRR